MVRSLRSLNFRHQRDLLTIPNRLRPGEQPLHKKGRGKLIHVSDFINPETGRLTVTDAAGKIMHDARKIIFPGSDGDPWWDTKQLIEQIKRAIEIFELAHPGKQALFVFDQSSAHASLAPDALKASILFPIYSKIALSTDIYRHLK
jgi:hypothetical protein